MKCAQSVTVSSGKNMVTGASPVLMMSMDYCEIAGLVARSKSGQGNLRLGDLKKTPCSSWSRQPTPGSGDWSIEPSYQDRWKGNGPQ
jgi:hypothetical protein